MRLNLDEHVSDVVVGVDRVHAAGRDDRLDDGQVLRVLSATAKREFFRNRSAGPLCPKGAEMFRLRAWRRLLASLLPVAGSEVVDAGDGPAGQQAQDVAQIALGFDAVEAAAGDERGEGGVDCSTAAPSSLPINSQFSSRSPGF